MRRRVHGVHDDTEYHVPADMEAVTQPGGSAALVLFDDPQAASGCGTVTVTCVPPSGSSFAIGPTQVTCGVVDASNNQNSCAFAVNVVAAPAQVPASGRVAVAVLVLFLATLGALVLGPARR